ncbi:MAG: TonB-dependent receptor [Cytophagaceae bacterium SCN 52-12]|nr:MAG: TonB-dependent receptor [Cytophagaceae bacterium SCN 52-12]
MLGHESAEDSVLVQDGQTSFVTGLLDLKPGELSEVVVTGQSEPMTLKNSVYQVRTISSEKIRLRGATNIQTVLNTELGIRLSNDMALGTTDIELLGMSGQNVKILLDGIPLLDRGAIRESLGQIDVNTIERIEIVEGPMSVIYGTDALAGVINLITKKGQGNRTLNVNARLQEETANDEYSAFNGAGVHNQSVNVTWRSQPWQVSGGISRNNFGGWQGGLTGRAKAWMPKEQMLYNVSLGFQKNKMHLWYRFNGTDEVLKSLGNINVNSLVASDKKYTTWRWFHQLQGEFNPNEKLSFTVTGAYTDYSRKTLSTNTDFATGQTTLSLEPGSQDKSTFNSVFGRAIMHYKLNPSFLIIGGAEYNFNEALGARIQGTPTIHDYAVFLTPEIRLANEKINLRPGVRFIHNSVYNAPPAIPSINTKLRLSPRADLRIAYAKGFRAPALRELYFWFFDASHSIRGNPNLKAESSDSFNAFFNYTLAQSKDLRVNMVLGGFYNHFKDRIEEAVDPENTAEWSYFNISKFKTTGASLNTTLFWKSLQATAGFQWTGFYNQYTEIKEQDLPEFDWSPELNLNVIYNIVPLKASVNFSYKYTGPRPRHQLVSSQPLEVRKVEVASFHMADLTLNKSVGSMLTINGGVRNLFNVTSLTNTSTDTGGAHTGGSTVPMSYGRSYFLGLAFNWNKTK